jgi:hypothetical protein
MDIVDIVCTTTASINLAVYQNAIPIIRELSIHNATGAEVGTPGQFVEPMMS